MKFKLRHLFLILLNFLLVSFNFSQKGKHGAVIVSALNTKINEFTDLSLSASAGNTMISVSNSGLNSNARFSSTLQVGDLIMIIQMQGAIIKTFTNVISQDSTYGQILNYNNAGNYEFAQVYAIPNATSIVLDCGLQYNYLLSGKTQIVRMPRYSSLTVNLGASITTDNWNGITGGIIAAEVDGLTKINGTVTASGMGFRGGLAANDAHFGGSRFVDLGAGSGEGGFKGEGIAGSVTDYSLNDGGAYAKGAPANGGGGGNSHAAGGANAGNINGWSGYGMVSSTYSTSYDLEYIGRSLVVSSGGGKGGYSSSVNNLNPLVAAPGNTLWGGDNRRKQGGFGGRPLDYSGGKIFMGGGGGAGHVSNLGSGNVGGTGGNGGGLIFFETFSGVGGTGLVSSDGIDGTTATGPNPGPFSSSVNGNDAGGGGGAGGTVIFCTNANVTGITIEANGGLGGNQQIVKGGLAAGNTEAEGPGGGGGGGYIAFSAGTPVESVLGAVGGTTNSNPMASFPPNGSSSGADGLQDQIIKLYVINTTGATVCVGSSATLMASTNATAANFFWYTSAAGPSQIGTGSAFTTSVFTTPGTYTVFAENCPGSYREPAVITVVGPPTIAVASQTICSVQTLTLTASGATTYTWSTGSNTSTTVVTPTATSIYTVSGTNVCTAQTTATVSLQVPPSFTLTPSAVIICNNQSITINSSGTAGSYSWSNGAGNTPSISLNIPGVYTASLSNFCGIAIHSLAINAGPSTTLSLSSSANTICAGLSVTLTASGMGTFAWSTTTVNTSTVTVSTSGIYFVTLNNICGTSNSSIAISNGPQPTVNVVPAASVFCSGQAAVLTATGSATNYTWSTGSMSPTLTTFSAGNFTVVGSNPCGIAKTVVTVTFQNSPDVSVASNKLFVCPNDMAVLTATNFSGGGQFAWSSSANTSSVENITTGGIYTVSYVNSCGVASATISVLQSTLIPDFIFSPQGGNAPVTISFTNTSVDNMTNQWNFGNGQSTGNLSGSSNYAVPGIYTITLVIQNLDGCSALVSKTIEITSEQIGIIPEAITPNGDGKNETFQIKGIENYPNNDFQVYNRWGNLVYSMKGYKNTFDGTPNYKTGSVGKLPSGTYYYILNLGDAENKAYHGFMEIIY